MSASMSYRYDEMRLKKCLWGKDSTLESCLIALLIQKGLRRRDGEEVHRSRA